jgi:hypothetical protein
LVLCNQGKTVFSEGPPIVNPVLAAVAEDIDAKVTMLARTRPTSLGVWEARVGGNGIKKAFSERYTI